MLRNLSQRILTLLYVRHAAVPEPGDPHFCICAMLRDPSQGIRTLLYVRQAAGPEPGDPHTAECTQCCGNWSRGYSHLLCVRHAAATDPGEPHTDVCTPCCDTVPEPGDPHTAACAPCCWWASPRTLALSPKRQASTAGQHLTHHIVSVSKTAPNTPHRLQHVATMLFAISWTNLSCPSVFRHRRGTRNTYTIVLSILYGTVFIYAEITYQNWNGCSTFKTYRYA